MFFRHSFLPFLLRCLGGISLGDKSTKYNHSENNRVFEGGQNGFCSCFRSLSFVAARWYVLLCSVLHILVDARCIVELMPFVRPLV